MENVTTREKKVKHCTILTVFCENFVCFKENAIAFTLINLKMKLKTLESYNARTWDSMRARTRYTKISVEHVIRKR